MTGRVATVVADRMRMAAVLGVAVAIGAGGSAYALTASHDSSTTVTTVAASSRPSATPSGQPTSPGRSGDHSQQGEGTHGACVAKVARDKTAVGGAHDNHGGAVAAAAHSCPKPGGAGATGGATPPGRSGTHGQDNSGTRGRSGQHSQAPGASTGRPTAGS